MKKTAFATIIVYGLIVSLVFGVQLIQLVGANGIIVHELNNGSPEIAVESPLNDKLFSSNTVVVSFTLTRPSYNWTSSKGTSNIVVYVNVTVDEAVYSRVDVYSDLRVPYSNSLNLADLQNGSHSLQLDAYCKGSTTYQIMNGFPAEESVILYETLSDVVSFTVYAPEATPSPEPTIEPGSFPTSLVTSSVTVAVVCIGLGLLVYLFKRK